MNTEGVYLKKPYSENWMTAGAYIAVVAWCLFLSCEIIRKEIKMSNPDWWALGVLALIIGGMSICFLYIAAMEIATLEFTSSGVRVLLLGRALWCYPREKMRLFFYVCVGGGKEGPYFQTGISMLSPEEITEKRRSVYKRKSLFRTDEKYITSKPDWELKLQEEYLRKKHGVFHLRTDKWLFVSDKNTKDILAVLHYLYPEVPVVDYSTLYKVKYTQKEHQSPVMPLWWKHPNVEMAALILAMIGIVATIMLLSEKGLRIWIPASMAFILSGLLLYAFFAKDRIWIDQEGISAKRRKKVIRYYPSGQVKTAVQLDMAPVFGISKDRCYVIISTQTREEILQSGKQYGGDWQALLRRLPDYQERMIVKKWISMTPLQ